MFKNSSRSKPVGRWSSWSSEGPLKVALSRLPFGAFVNSLELSSTLGSFRIPSAALCRGSCKGCHKDSIVRLLNTTPRYGCTRDVFYVRREIDLVKTAKVNAYIVHIFGKIELLSIHAT